MSAAGKNVVRAAVRAPGRLEQRRERFLQEAEALFLEHGYAGASVNEIVRRAGGSLATLYNEFGSKEQLFAEIARRRAAFVFGPGVPRRAPVNDVRSELLALATRMLDRILGDDGLAMYRIAISEGPRFNDLREAILDGSLPAFLETLRATLVDLGVARASAGVEVAEDFVSLVHGQLVFRAACGGAITAKRKARHIERAVDAFLALHPPQ